MTESAVLDVLLGAIIVLVALIGYWQGIVRSLLVIGGALIGSELALWWSDNAGDRLADVLPFSPDTGRFVAATVLILLASLVLGVLPGNLASRPEPVLRERLGGIGASLMSALLIIGLVIRYFHIHMAARAQDALQDTHLALALWDRFDWIVLASAISGVAALVVFWVLGSPEPELRSFNTHAMSPGSWTSTSRSSNRESSGTDLSRHRPLERVPAASTNDHALYGMANADDERVQRITDTYQQLDGSRDDLLGPVAGVVLTESDTGGQDIDSAGQTSAVRSAASQSSDFNQQYAAVAAALAFSDERVRPDEQSSPGICPNCGMLLGSGDLFCPDCGHPVD